ncbi:MAG: hypothetical protein JW874_04200 [Spirochaetales bacterium]|nr:hypothetical protein [Spirochaetales bacterium]
MIRKDSLELKNDLFRIEIPVSHLHFFREKGLVDEIKKLKEDINRRNSINIKTIRILDNISLADNCFSFMLRGEKKQTCTIGRRNFQNVFYRKIEDFAIEHRNFFC